MKNVFAVAGLLAVFAVCAHADEAPVRDAIQALVPNASIDSIEKSELPGFHEVNLGGQLIYVSSDGRYLIQGNIFDIVNRVDLTEQKRNGSRKTALAQVPAPMRIVFEPKDVKHRVTVFTDIDCGYCRRLHQEMADYNAHGIAIEYLWYPRAGVGSESFQKAVNVWCAPDRNQAMTQAKAGRELERRSCDNPVASDYQLGQQLGITGTPALITEDGALLPGYLPADQLLARLDGLKQAAATANAD